jgi:hypothetical protein
MRHPVNKFPPKVITSDKHSDQGGSRKNNVPQPRKKDAKEKTGGIINYPMRPVKIKQSTKKKSR